MAPRSILVTGCSKGGAGEALARKFHQNGYRVFATARDLSKIRHLESEGIEILKLDVLDSQSIKKASETVAASTGNLLDILINNAGSGYMAPILDVDNDRVRKLFDVNVIAPISVAKAFTPLLIAAKGTIVNVGSYADNLAVPWQGIYNASKAALRAVTDNLRVEIRPFNVNVVYIAAGGISSNFLENLETFRLSKDSLYYPGKDLLEPIINYEQLKTNGSGSMRPEEFAQEVYDASTAGTSAYRAYAGTQSPLTTMPQEQREDLLASGTGIDAFSKEIKQTIA